VKLGDKFNESNLGRGEGWILLFEDIQGYLYTMGDQIKWGINVHLGSFH
jgi:hypothetical protein